MYELATCKFVREAGDILLIGPPGTGKTHLCVALGLQAIKMGLTVLYRSIFDVVREFMKDEAFAGEDKVLRKYLKPDLLIVDDMGMKQLPKRSGEFLFEVIMRRHENRSTVMTSNRPIEDWGKLLGDVPAATAILDRFLPACADPPAALLAARAGASAGRQHAEIISITGKSDRLKNRACRAKAKKRS